MPDPIRDLEHRFRVDERIFTVQVCGCGSHPAPTSEGDADVVLFECVPESLLDHEDDEPHKIAHDVVNHAQRFLPSSIHQAQWDELHDAITDWVCEHRAAAANSAHEA
jgi:hypothetical protein